jgi:hypothetical protein
MQPVASTWAELHSFRIVRLAVALFGDTIRTATEEKMKKKKKKKRGRQLEREREANFI